MKKKWNPYRKYGQLPDEDEYSADDAIEELDTLIEEERVADENPFELYVPEEGDGDVDEATTEIKVVVSECALKLSEVIEKWQSQGATDTASKEAIINYLGSEI